MVADDITAGSQDEGMTRHHSSSLRGPRPRPSDTPPPIKTAQTPPTHRPYRPPGPRPSSAPPHRRRQSTVTCIPVRASPHTRSPSRWVRPPVSPGHWPVTPHRMCRGLAGYGVWRRQPELPPPTPAPASGAHHRRPPATGRWLVLTPPSCSRKPLDTK